MCTGSLGGGRRQARKRASSDPSEPKDSLLIHSTIVIQSCDYAEVRYFRMARTFLGRAIYWTGVYYVDGLLVDSGPPNLAHEDEGTHAAGRDCLYGVSGEL